MGSGLILLVIVGAWLAFFVQLALRSNETTNVLGTVDKFHDAMRVLSRRQVAPRTPGSAPAEGRGPGRGPGSGPGPGLDPGPGTPARVRTSRYTSAVATSTHSPRSADPGAPLSESDRRRAEAAARRTKVLIGLAATAVVTLLAAAVFSWWLLVPHLLVDLLLGGLLVHLRALALGRAAAEQRLAEALARERAAARAAARSVEVRRPVPVVRRPVQIHVAGVPDRMPARPRPLIGPTTGQLPAPGPAAPTVPAARSAQPAETRRVRGAQGGSWSPVQIPVPTYLSAPTAPRRVVDPTRSAAVPERRPSSEPEVGLHDAAPVVETVQPHRRAVND